VLADKRAQLVELGALGNYSMLVTGQLKTWARLTRDSVLVAEFLQLRLAPCVNEPVGESSISFLGRLLGALGLLLHAQVGKARVAANGGDELVALITGLAAE
jgi:hypothetical protein